MLKEEADECEINGALNYETTAARSETKVEEEKLKLRRTSSQTLMTRASGSSWTGKLRKNQTGQQV